MDVNQPGVPLTLVTPTWRQKPSGISYSAGNAAKAALRSTSASIFMSRRQVASKLAPLKPGSAADEFLQHVL
jgi:hypothetical protein